MQLQPSSLENGCMEFMPGSHKNEVFPHQSIDNDPRIHRLELAVEIVNSRKFACPLPADGATMHHCRTLHYTGPNRLAEPRRALILNFGTHPLHGIPPGNSSGRERNAPQGWREQPRRQGKNLCELFLNNHIFRYNASIGDQCRFPKSTLVTKIQNTESRKTCLKI